MLSKRILHFAPTKVATTPTSISSLHKFVQGLGEKRFYYTNSQYPSQNNSNEKASTGSNRPRSNKSYSGRFGGRSRAQTNTSNVSDNLRVTKDGFESVFVSISPTNQKNTVHNTSSKSYDKDKSSNTNTRKTDYRNSASRRQKSSQASVVDFSNSTSVNRNEAIRTILDMSLTSESSANLGGEEYELSGKFTGRYVNSEIVDSLSKALSTNSLFLSSLTNSSDANAGTSTQTELNSESDVQQTSSSSFTSEQTSEIDPLDTHANSLLSIKPNGNSALSHCSMLLTAYQDYCNLQKSESDSSELSFDEAKLNTLAFSQQVLLRAFSVFLFKDNFQDALTVLECALLTHTQQKKYINPAFFDKLFAYLSLKHDTTLIFSLYNALSGEKSVAIPVSSVSSRLDQFPVPKKGKANEKTEDILTHILSLLGNYQMSISELSPSMSPSSSSSSGMMNEYHLLTSYSYSCTVRELIRSQNHTAACRILTEEMPLYGFSPPCFLLLQTARLMTETCSIDQALNFISPHIPHFSRFGRAQFVALFVTATITSGNPEKGLSILTTFGQSSNLFSDERFIASIMKDLFKINRKDLAENLFYQFSMDRTLLKPKDEEYDDFATLNPNNSVAQRLRKSEHHRGGFFPTMTTFNILIENHLLANDYPQAIQYLEYAVAHDISPPLSTMSLFLAYSVKQKDFDLGIVILKHLLTKNYDIDVDMIQQMMKLSALAAVHPKSAKSMQQLLHPQLATAELFSSKDFAIRQISSLLNFMKSRSMSMNHSTIEAAVESYCTIGAIDEAIRIVEQDAKTVYKVRLTDYMFTTIINYAAMNERFSDSFKLLGVLGTYNPQHQTHIVYKKHRWLLQQLLNYSIQQKNTSAATQVYEMLKQYNITIRDNTLHSLIDMMQKEGEYKFANTLKKSLVRK